MIQTLQKKFIRTAMVAVSVLLFALLGSLNLVNARAAFNRSDRLLEALIKNESEMPPPYDRRGFLNPPPTEDEKRAAVFFTVRVAPDGLALQTDVSRISSVTEERAREIAEKIFAEGKHNGRFQMFRYAGVQLPDGCEVYIFLDISSDLRSVGRVLFLSAFAGAAGWFLMLLFVTLLSRKAIRPIAENIEKQKRFVTDAGHEIKTPLAIILANIDAMELYNGENKWSRNIRQQASRLNDLMQNLLLLARADEKGVVADRETVFLAGLVRETMAGFQEPMELKGLRFRAEIGEEVSLAADRESLRQMISILLDNAVKYSASGTEISLALRTGSDPVILRVTNTCEALPACAPEKLFDRFYRAEPSRGRKNGGCGIGLSAARAIAERQGGRIRAGYGDGNTIFFTVEFASGGKRR